MRTNGDDFFDINKYNDPIIDQSGWYTVEIVGIQRKRARSGTEGYEFTYRVLLGPSAGAIVRDTFWDTPSALNRLARFTRLFYDGAGYSRSDAKSIWSVYAGARVALEIHVDHDGRTNVRRFARVSEKDRPSLVAIPRFAPLDPPDGITVPKEFYASAVTHPVAPSDTVFDGPDSGDDLPF